MCLSRSRKTTWLTVLSALRIAESRPTSARCSAETAPLSDDSVSTSRVGSGGRRSRQKDTVLFCKAPPADPAVVGAEEPGGVIPAEELGALSSSLREVLSQLLFGPDSFRRGGDLLTA